jgi:hypothetical protein
LRETPIPAKPEPVSARGQGRGTIDEERETGDESGFFFYALVYNVGAAQADTNIKERNIMNNDNPTTREEIICHGDCLDCPYFDRTDICGYEVPWTLN